MIEIEINDAEINAAFARITQYVDDLTPLMQRAGELLTASTKQRFIDGESPEGVKWAAKSQVTLDNYARRGDKIDLRPLFGPRGNLRSQIFSVADSDSVIIGSDREYAGTMQFGASKGQFGTASNGSPVPWGDIPARPFLGISDEDRANIIQDTIEWLEEGFRA